MGVRVRKLTEEGEQKEPGEADAAAEIGSVYITQPQRVPEEAGFWATQVPPPGTGSAHEQYPGGSYRRKARKCEPARHAIRKPGAATACDRASPGPEQIRQARAPGRRSGRAGGACRAGQE
eukprot:8466312-Heterocapsa_arctica.AAC.1